MEKNKTTLKLLLPVIATGLGGCASMKSFFAVETKNYRQPPIQNPFEDYRGGRESNENIVLRTKKGDRSIEVELPGRHAEMTDFTIPISPAFKDSHSRGPASAGEAGGLVDETYRERQPSMSDREITSTFQQGSVDQDGNRREIETGLGLQESEDSVPDTDKSYLAQLDHVKQLYKNARYEAALLEVDELIRGYPTDPKLYEMRGTLLDRVGRMDLAIKSWNQALRFDPKNDSLRRFIERKQQKRSLASP